MTEILLSIAILLLGSDVAYRFVIHRRMKHETHSVYIAFKNYHNEVLADYEFINGEIKAIQNQITTSTERPQIDEQLNWR